MPFLRFSMAIASIGASPPPGGAAPPPGGAPAGLPPGGPPAPSMSGDIGILLGGLVRLDGDGTARVRRVLACAQREAAWSTTPRSRFGHRFGLRGHLTMAT